MDSLSKCAFLTHMFDDHGHSTLGTSFLYRRGDRDWLVTAGHNITGRHAETGNPMEPYDFGTYPVRLSLKVPQEGIPHEDDPRYKLFGWQDVEMPLYEGNGQASWIAHPAGLTWDLAALDVSGDERFAHALGALDAQHDHVDFEPSVGDDVFILGFPEGITGGGRLPIWKRGTIASEPETPLPYLLVDTATRQGMSGAPVFVQRSGITVPRGGTKEKDAIFGQSRDFLGIYVARPLADPHGLLAQLGRVFKRQVIEFVLDAGQRWTGPQ